MNAVIHRDYSISDNIHIHVFNNRIEVLSPGEVAGICDNSTIFWNHATHEIQKSFEH